MASVDTIRLPSGQEWDVQDYGHYPLWTTHAAITSERATESRGFNYGEGETIPGTNRLATLRDTNFRGSGSGGLGFAEEMLIYSIMIELPHRAMEQQDGDPHADQFLLRDLLVFLENTVFRFNVTDKVYSEGIVTRYPFGGGLWAVTNVNDAELVNNGEPSHMGQKPLAVPIHLMSMESFSSLLLFPYGNVGVLFNTWFTDPDTGVQAEEGYDFRVWLDGIRRRPVA